MCGREGVSICKCFCGGAVASTPLDKFDESSHLRANIQNSSNELLPFDANLGKIIPCQNRKLSNLPTRMTMKNIGSYIQGLSWDTLGLTFSGLHAFPMYKKKTSNGQFASQGILQICYVTCWLVFFFSTHLKNMLVKWDHFPFPHKKCVSCHQLATT